MIGDPSGRSTDRKAMAQTELEKNISGSLLLHCKQNSITLEFPLGIRKSLDFFFKVKSDRRDMLQPVLLNNLDWYKDMGVVEYLSKVCSGFRVSSMLARDSVKSRIESANGISLSEFCYQTLQGYDFKILHQNHDCTVQIGGSDQWGNMTAGLGLMKDDAFVMTGHLLF